MKEIGGFFELELNSNGSLYHNNALAFNSGSSALEFFLINSKYNSVYIPYYTCDEVIKVIKKLNLSYHFYNINSNFQPQINLDVLNDKTLLIINIYFGINNQNVNELLNLSKHIIVDASQAFFYKPLKNRFSFNSIRKFFGVPDGGFLCGTISGEMKKNYAKLSYTKYNHQHLVGRLEENAKVEYFNYIENEKIISENSMGIMSKLTDALLNNVNFKKVKKQRLNNFKKLNSYFKEYNELDLRLQFEKDIPHCYPLLISNGFALKKFLIYNNIYIPTYWENIRKYLSQKSKFELNLVDNLVCLPIDQRYTEKEMNYIIDSFKSFMNE